MYLLRVSPVNITVSPHFCIDDGKLVENNAGPSYTGVFASSLIKIAKQKNEVWRLRQPCPKGRLMHLEETFPIDF